MTMRLTIPKSIRTSFAGEKGNLVIRNLQVFPETYVPLIEQC